mgnify:CR=1 FL=1
MPEIIQPGPLEGNYTQIANSAVRDKNLTGQDFRVYAYLRSLPNKAETDRNRIARALGLNGKTVDKAARKLRERGYVVAEERRNPNGTKRPPLWRLTHGQSESLPLPKKRTVARQSSLPPPVSPPPERWSPVPYKRLLPKKSISDQADSADSQTNKRMAPQGPAPLRAYSGAHPDTAPAPAHVGATLAALGPYLGPLNRDSLTKEVIDATKEGPEYNAWWGEVVQLVANCGEMGELEDKLKYVRDCANPATRRAKDLGELPEPGKYMAARMKEVLARHKKHLPKFPKPCKAEQN